MASKHIKYSVSFLLVCLFVCLFVCFFSVWLSAGSLTHCRQQLPFQEHITWCLEVLRRIEYVYSFFSLLLRAWARCYERLRWGRESFYKSDRLTIQCIKQLLHRLQTHSTVKKKGAAISDIIRKTSVHCYSRFEGRVAWQLLLTELAVGVVAVLKAYQPEWLYSQPQRQPQWWSFSTKATCNGYAYVMRWIVHLTPIPCSTFALHFYTMCS